jgi:hypothetical protein
MWQMATRILLIYIHAIDFVFEFFFYSAEQQQDGYKSQKHDIAKLGIERKTPIERKKI